MAKILIFILCLTSLAWGTTGADIVAGVRQLTGDVGTAKTPFTWSDSAILLEVNQAIGEAGVVGLAVTVWDTVSLSTDVLSYSLSREPIELQTAYRLDESGGMFGVSLVNVADFWNVSDQTAYCLVDRYLFVTQKLSEQFSMVVIYTADPATVDSLGGTLDTPGALDPAITFMTSSNLLTSTRTQTNVAIGQAYRQSGMQVLMRWLQAHRGKATDSLAVPK